MNGFLRFPMIVAMWTFLSLIAAVPCMGEDTRLRPVSWGAESVSADKLLEGVESITLRDSDYFFDGGSLIYQAEGGEDQTLYIGLPHPAAVLANARRKNHQHVLLSRKKNFNQYAIVKKGSEAEKKLIALLRSFAENGKDDEEPPRAQHGQNLLEAARSIAMIVQTCTQPDTWGAEALGVTDSLFP